MLVNYQKVGKNSNQLIWLVTILYTDDDEKALSVYEDHYK